MKIRSIFVLLSVFLFSSCASSYLQNSSNVSGDKKRYNKIVVVAKAKDKLSRIKFEEQVVRDLAAQGIQAQTSKDIILSNSFEKELSEDEMEEIRLKLVDQGYDGAIVTNLVNIDKYTDVIPGTSGTALVPVRYGRFGRYYRSYPVSYWEADEVKTGVKYNLETCLYDITENKMDNLQWVGRFQVKDPSSLIKTVEKYSKELTEKLLVESISAN